MTTQDSGQTITDADVTSLATKLDGWARSLTPAEQTLLHRLIARAASADVDDTEGHFIIDWGISDRGIIINGQPAPLFVQSLGLKSLSVDVGRGRPQTLVFKPGRFST
jgi:hypothetical protein